eukprot:scaffold302493_cov17-Tisochrysis_lutea.AAC.1
MTTDRAHSATRYFQAPESPCGRGGRCSSPGSSMDRVDAAPLAGEPVALLRTRALKASAWVLPPIPSLWSRG